MPGTDFARAPRARGTGVMGWVVGHHLPLAYASGIAFLDTTKYRRGKVRPGPRHVHLIAAHVGGSESAVPEHCRMSSGVSGPASRQ
jgi:hypothetical protein